MSKVKSVPYTQIIAALERGGWIMVYYKSGNINLLSLRIMTLEEALNIVKQLSPVDKVRLIEQITPDIKQELLTKNTSPRQSLWGLCANLGKAPSAKEIDEARSQEWANFPREDI